MPLKYGFILLVCYVVLGGTTIGTEDNDDYQYEVACDYVEYIDDNTTTTETTPTDTTTLPSTIVTETSTPNKTGEDCDYVEYIDENTTTTQTTTTPTTTTTLRPTTIKICRKYEDCQDQHCEEDCEMLERCPSLLHQFFKFHLECGESGQEEVCD